MQSGSILIVLENMICCKTPLSLRMEGMTSLESQAANDEAGTRRRQMRRRDRERAEQRDEQEQKRKEKEQAQKEQAEQKKALEAEERRTRKRRLRAEQNARYLARNILCNSSA